MPESPSSTETQACLAAPLDAAGVLYQARLGDPPQRRMNDNGLLADSPHARPPDVRLLPQHQLTLNFKQLQAKNIRGLSKCMRATAGRPLITKCTFSMPFNSAGGEQAMSQQSRPEHSSVSAPSSRRMQSLRSSAADRGHHPSRSRDSCWTLGRASPRAT